MISHHSRECRSGSSGKVLACRVWTLRRKLLCDAKGCHQQKYDMTYEPYEKGHASFVRRCNEDLEENSFVGDAGPRY